MCVCVYMWTWVNPPLRTLCLFYSNLMCEQDVLNKEPIKSFHNMHIVLHILTKLSICANLRKYVVNNLPNWLLKRFKVEIKTSNGDKIKSSSADCFHYRFANAHYKFLTMQCNEANIPICGCFAAFKKIN